MFISSVGKGGGIETGPVHRFDTGEELVKEDGCLNSFETRRGLFSCMCDAFIELSLFHLE